MKEIKLKSLQTQQYLNKTLLFVLGENGKIYLGTYDPETGKCEWNGLPNPEV